MSVNHTPSAVLCPIKRAARKIHAQLGGGQLTGVYLDALETWFSGGKNGMERNVLLSPVGERRLADGSVLPRSALSDGLRADFTFKHRTVLVRVLSQPDPVSEKALQNLWFALNDTGLPLGIIMNFGRSEFESAHVVHRAYEHRFKQEQGLIPPDLIPKVSMPKRPMAAAEG
ncbi:hypothetical protein AGMMS49587_08730 [Spirochaetia bacterium]|nr:hypothetical protein AGMMS49587_08730 [Spirochaetia bacterium]